MRPFVLGVLGLSGVGFCLFSTFVAFAINQVWKAPLQCDTFIEHPVEDWVTLVGCRLDFDEAVLIDGENVERLADRKIGLAHSLQPAGFEWKTIMVPVKSPHNLIRPSRVVWPITDGDALAWVNAIERSATEEERKRLGTQTKVIDRLATPARMTGRGERGAKADQVQRVLGREGMAGLLVLQPGVIPPPQVPAAGFFLGVLGAIAFGFGVKGFGQRKPLGASAGAELTNADVSGVKVEIGELEALRREEAQERRRRKR